MPEGRRYRETPTRQDDDTDVYMPNPSEHCITSRDCRAPRALTLTNGPPALSPGESTPNVDKWSPVSGGIDSGGAELPLSASQR
jgi:hypothetical protein